MAEKIYQRIAELLVRLRYLLLLVALLMATIALLFGGSMTFDRSIESMFRADDRLLQDFERLKRCFTGDEILMVAYHDDQLMNVDRTGIDRLETAGNRLKAIDGIQEIVSLAEIDNVLGGKFARLSDRAGSSDGKKLFSGITDPNQPLARRLTQLFAGYTHSHDQKIAAIICILDEPAEGVANREQIIADIRAQMALLGEEDRTFSEMTLIGEPVMIADSFEMIEQDGVRLRWSSSILMVLTIFVFFRSVRWMLIPLVVVQFSLLMTRATLAWSGLQLTMVSSMLDAIVTVIGVAATVHIIVRYRRARRGGEDRKQSVTSSLKLLIAPIFWAIATDTAGFLALWFSALGPVRDFAIMMGIGSMMVLVSTLLLVPGLSLLPLPKALHFLDNDPTGSRQKSLLDTGLQRPLSLARRYPVMMATLLILASAFVSCGIFFNEVESDFTKNFRKDSEIARSYEFVESNLGGAGVWDVIVPAPNKIDYEYVLKIQRLETRLREEVVINVGDANEPFRIEAGLSKVISLVDVITSVLGTDIEKIPFGRDAVIGATALTMRLGMPGYYGAVLGSDNATVQNEDGKARNKQQYLRIMLRSKERRSTDQKKQIIRQVEKITREEMGVTEDDQSVFITGYYVLIANMIDSVIRDQWTTFLIAIGCIFLMLVIATRSLRYALISLVPNVVPILMVLGTLGWLDQKVNIGVAMIAAVSVGLSVDSSIHYIISFKRALAGGADVGNSLDNVQTRVGRALVFSTLAIVLGFATLCTSSFIPIVYFGVLSIMAMVGGLIGNLVVLPLLLQVFTGNRETAHAETTNGL